jgi:hypothetical protein
MTFSFLQDGEGNNSSKRLAGLLLIGIGIVLSIILFWRSLTSPVGDSQTALSIIDIFLITGGGLLGVSIFDNLKIGGKNGN